MNTKSSSILNMPLIYYPVGILDYVYVSTIYIISALLIAGGINGFMPTFNPKKAMAESTISLTISLAIVVSLQGFFACVVTTLLHMLPSPINGLFGYNTNSPIGTIVRNPAIITLLLFMMNDTVHGILPILLARSTQQVRAL